MPKFRVGCVPYVNAAPLIWHFVNQGNQSPIEVIFDVPSKLPHLHESGKIDAMLVSSIDSLKQPSAEVVAGVCIGSNGPVESVRLFSRVPFERVESLALDQSSMTSNALAKIILKEQFGITPKYLALEPNLNVMLDLCDAAVIIGDNGMVAEYPDAHILDLGQAWTDAYHAPFIWALWTSYRPINPELASLLQQPILDYPETMHQVFDYAAETAGWDYNLVKRYLTNCVRFEFGEPQHKSLQLFATKLVQNKVLPVTHFPKIVDGLREITYP
ncbi:MAG: menaquinone biosynthetic enzyme MqnA/MqnD family protein [Fimbriimonadaceae bacterium]